MTHVRIERWHNRYSGVRLPDATRERWDAAIEDLADGDVFDSLVSGDEWVLVRRVHVAARFTEEDAEQKFQDHSRRALRDELARLLASPNEDVVRYRDEADALADFLYRSLAADLERTWAWFELGWLPTATTPELARVVTPSVARAAAVVALGDRPHFVFPILSRLAAAESETGALTLLFGNLPAEAWALLFRACPQTQPFETSGFEAEALRWGDSSVAVHAPRSVLATNLLSWAIAHPQVALSRSSPLSIWLAAALASEDGAHVRAGPLERARALLAAYLPAKEASRAADRAGAVSKLGAATERHDGGAASRRSDIRRSDREREDETDVLRAAGLSVDEMHDAPRADATPLLPLPAVQSGEPTEWGGVLFLLHLVARGPLLAELAQLEIEWALSRALFAVARAIGVPANDPAAAAFALGYRPDASELDGDGVPALPPTAEGIVAHTLADFEAWLAEHVDDVPHPRATAVARRPGAIVLEPGYISLTLALDTVDPRLRRAGLDLDPGFVPFLRAAVRFNYV